MRERKLSPPLHPLLQFMPVTLTSEPGCTVLANAHGQGPGGGGEKHSHQRSAEHHVIMITIICSATLQVIFL